MGFQHMAVGGVWCILYGVLRPGLGSWLVGSAFSPNAFYVQNFCSSTFYFLFASPSATQGFHVLSSSLRVSPSSTDGILVWQFSGLELQFLPFTVAFLLLRFV
jgi:hypothetical protein